MRVLLFLLFAISTLGCKPILIKDFKLPSNEDYNLIIKSIIEQDKLILGQEQNLNLKNELEPLKIRMTHFVKDEMALIDLDDFNSSIEFFLAIEMIDAANIEMDSLYIAYQNDSDKKLSLNPSLQKQFGFLFTQNNFEIQKVRFSVPILNFAQNKAYVHALIGYNLRLHYLLVKVADKWKIINTEVERLMRCG